MPNLAEQQITFNTDRPYSAEGQIITAKVIADDGLMKRVLFSDKTRHIDGEVTVKELSQTSIMQEYDAGNYELR